MNVCAPRKLKPNPKRCNGIWTWGLWEVIRSWGQSPSSSHSSWSRNTESEPLYWTLLIPGSCLLSCSRENGQPPASNCQHVRSAAESHVPLVTPQRQPTSWSWMQWEYKGSDISIWPRVLVDSRFQRSGRFGQRFMGAAPEFHFFPSPFLS